MARATSTTTARVKTRTDNKKIEVAASVNINEVDAAQMRREEVLRQRKDA
jgi:hypothetical protein